MEGELNSVMRSSKYFAVYAPNGDLVAKEEATIHPDGTYRHTVSTQKAWHKAGCDYTGTPYPLHQSVLMANGYTYKFLKE